MAGQRQRQLQPVAAAAALLPLLLLLLLEVSWVSMQCEAEQGQQLVFCTHIMQQRIYG
jgi:hypothetical protein